MTLLNRREMMSNIVKLTKEDLDYFKTSKEEAIHLVQHFSRQYVSKKHYYELGASCVMSASSTIKTIINSAGYLDGMFLMPDTVNIQKVVEWFLKNREYECDKDVLTFYMAHFLKRRINRLYRNINNGSIEYSTAILGGEKGFEEFQKQIKIRQEQGVKLIRN